MMFELGNRLVVGVSARALFDLEYEHDIFEREGLEAYIGYQLEHEEAVLKPGPGFWLVEALLSVNELPGCEGRVEVVLTSHNNADASLRIFKSIAHYGLPITRAVLSGGSPIAPYLTALGADLFLSANEEEVRQATNCGIAAGVICTKAAPCPAGHGGRPQIRIAFDGDAVLFSDEAERIFAREGLTAFEENERRKADDPLGEGPFARFLKGIAAWQQEFMRRGELSPFRTALVTSRCAPAHERVVRTLRAWGVRIDESFFLGGISKRDVLAAFGAHIFFDDQRVHTERAAEVVPAALVPGGRGWRSDL